MSKEKIELNKQSKKDSTGEYFSLRTDYWDEVYNKNSESDSFTMHEMRKRKDIVFNLLENKMNGASLKVLDAGCGAGHYMKEMIDYGFDAYGVDISKQMVEVTKSNVKHDENIEANVLCSDCEFLPFPDNYFDIITCIGVLEYNSDEVGVLKELKRVIKDNGYIIFTLPNLLKLRNVLDAYYYIIRFWKYLKVKFTGRYFTSKPDSVHSEYSQNANFTNSRYTFNQLKKIIQKSELVDVDIKGFGYGPFRIWRTEILPKHLSVRLSVFFEKLQTLKTFRFLNSFANRWVICSQIKNN
jgi:ubiquinone/menaquinone biosynthesis C-methylase UbiE